MEAVTREWLVADVSTFGPEERRLIDAGGHEVVVLRVGDAFKAYENRCVHMGGPVGEGVVMGRVETELDAAQRMLGERFSKTRRQLVCPWHGWAYDLETGRCAGDERRGLRSFGTVVREGRVYVRA